GLAHAAFCERVYTPIHLGVHSHVVFYSKRARRAKAAALLQPSLYSGLVAGMQGRAPEWMHLALGDGTRPRFRVSDYRAYLHHAKARLETVTAGAPIETYPEPVEHCGVCRWAQVCEQRWRDDDSLVLVAGLS